MSWDPNRKHHRANRDLAAQVLARDTVCRAQGPNCTQVATEDDHVVPLSEGGTDALSNHQGLCATCHAEKTAAEAQRGRERMLAKLRRPTGSHPGLR